MKDDTTHDTLPAPPPLETIPAGKAQLAVTLALARVVREQTLLADAVDHFEAIAMAVARQLDATSTGGQRT
jgi:hypothetical protein